MDLPDSNCHFPDYDCECDVDYRTGEGHSHCADGETLMELAKFRHLSVDDYVPDDTKAQIHHDYDEDIFYDPQSHDHRSHKFESRQAMEEMDDTDLFLYSTFHPYLAHCFYFLLNFLESKDCQPDFQDIVVDLILLRDCKYFPGVHSADCTFQLQVYRDSNLAFQPHCSNSNSEFDDYLIDGYQKRLEFVQIDLNQKILSRKINLQNIWNF